MSPPTRGPRWGLLVVGLLLMLPLGFVFLKNFGDDPDRAPEHKVRPAPPFALQTLDGSAEVALQDFQGKPVVINFWSTWCGPCKQEHPALLNAAGAHGDKVQFLGIVYNDDPRKSLAYLKQHGSAFLHLQDPKNTVSVDYGVTGVPETFFLDRDHQILRHEFFVTPLILEEGIAQILGEM